MDKETEYYFYNARHYDASISRFVTPDTVIDGELSTQGWNRYAYCHGNPVIYNDPTGHFVPVVVGIAVVAVITYLTPLNDKEYEGVAKQKGININDVIDKKHNSDEIQPNPRDPRKDIPISQVKEEAISKTLTEGSKLIDSKTFFGKENMMKQVIHQTYEAGKKLLESGNKTHWTSKALDYIEKNALKSVKEMSGPIAKVGKTAGKLVGPLANAIDIYSAYSESTNYSKQEGEKWDKVVDAKSSKEKQMSTK